MSSLRNLSLLGGAAVPSSFQPKEGLSLIEMALIVVGAYLLFKYMSNYKSSRAKSTKAPIKVTSAPATPVTSAPATPAAKTSAPATPAAKTSAPATPAAKTSAPATPAAKTRAPAAKK
jgi:hypothetical protein